MLQIVKVPNVVLTTPSKPVEKIDRKVFEFVEGMKATLQASHNPKGVGLAAPQVGRGIRVFITKPAPKSPFTVFINPEVIWTSEDKTEGVPERDNKFEGCLSIPNVWGIVHRHQSVKVTFQDEADKKHTQTFKGFLATIIQHEIDHINGILFIQRVLEQKNKQSLPADAGKLYRVTGIDKEGQDIFDEIEL